MPINMKEYKLDHKPARPIRIPALFALGIALVILFALLLFIWLMRPSQADLSHMALFLSGTALFSLIVGYGVYRLGWLGRFPRLQLTFLGGYFISSVLTFVNVWITAQLMFTSQHDLLLATVLLIFAGGIAMILGVFLAETLVQRITRLNQAAQRIAQGEFGVRVVMKGRDEVAELAASFNTMAVQLELAEEKKRELDTLRKDLVAWVGHDLQTPLASIRAIVEALADGLVDDPETIQRYLGIAKKDITAASVLIDDLFRMAQIDAGGLQLDMANGSIADLISDTLESHSELARQREIHLDGSVEDGIDPVYMDAQRVGRVLTNLVDNALRYTNQGGDVYVRATLQSDVVLVEVTDTGMGIADEDVPHVFERFYRGEKSRSRANGGAGLGLAIAHGIIEAHGGKIGVTNLPSKGARFYFTLPLYRNT